jgi:hypothetical protein
MTQLLAANPGASLPKAMGCEAAIEAGYRLLRNPRVTQAKLLEPHLEGTAALVKGHAGTVVVAHDTTEFCFPGESREGLGCLQNNRQGFFGHFGLALVPAPDVATPLGVLGFSNYFRGKKRIGRRSSRQGHKDPKNENKRWWKLVEECEERLEEGSPRPIHVMDREADSYEVMTELKLRGCRFVIRAAHVRRIEIDDNKAFDDGSQLPGTVVFERSVPINRRQIRGARQKIHPNRDARVVKLRIHARSMDLRRCTYLPESFPDALKLNLVLVEEIGCPDGEEPICWRLWTTEPVATVDDLKAVVDAYKSRWLIEEFFKALKTGCNYEKKQLDSADTLTTMLGLYIPIACQLLSLRSLTRSGEADLPATCLMSKGNLDALRALDRGKLPEHPTIGDALAAIARRGGHIKNNGAPGWQVLWRGYQDFLVFLMGWKAARERCDQS